MHRKVAVDSTHGRNTAIGRHQLCHGLEIKVGYNRVQKIKNNEGRRGEERVQDKFIKSRRRQQPWEDKAVDTRCVTVYNSG